MRAKSGSGSGHSSGSGRSSGGGCGHSCLNNPMKYFLSWRRMLPQYHVFSRSDVGSEAPAVVAVVGTVQTAQDPSDKQSVRVTVFNKTNLLCYQYHGPQKCKSCMRGNIGLRILVIIQHGHSLHLQVNRRKMDSRLDACCCS